MDRGFNQRLPPDWLGDKIAAQAWHFIQPALIHRTASGQRAEPHLRCQVMITMMVSRERALSVQPLLGRPL